MAFGVTDYILFFSSIESKSTIMKSVIGQIRASALGDIDYEVYAEADPNIGPLFFFTFVFIMIILLLNLLIAVMGEAYEDVQVYANARWCYLQLYGWLQAQDNFDSLNPNDDKEMTDFVTNALEKNRNLAFLMKRQATISKQINMSGSGRVIPGAFYLLSLLSYMFLSFL